MFISFCETCFETFSNEYANCYSIWINIIFFAYSSCIRSMFPLGHQKCDYLKMLTKLLKNLINSFKFIVNMKKIK